jgi:peptide/nickel transport system permease protein
MSAVPVIAPRARFARVRGTDPVLAVAGTVCALLLALAVIGPWIAPHPPTQIDLLGANAGLSATHPLGADALGRDNLSRVLTGARLSIIGPALVVVAASVLGTTLAIASAWIGGGFDAFVVKALNLLFAFPALLFALLAVAIFGEGLTAPVVALSIAYTPYLARVVRGVAVRERSMAYVDACRLAGLSGPRICTRHLLPNVAGLVRAQATIMFGAALVDLAAISFLGLGVQPPASEWGLMVSDGRAALLNGSPQEALAAGGMIVITVVAFNVLGERLAARAEAER